jgi:hypothetical protein
MRVRSYSFLRKLVIWSTIILIGASILYAQGSGTPSQLRVITDATGALLATTATQTLPLSNPTIFTNTRLRTDASGNLVVTVSGGGFAPADATYITQTPNANLTSEQALSTLSTGLMNVTTTTGVVTSIANVAAGSILTSGTPSAWSTTPSITTSLTVPRLRFDAGNIDIALSGGADLIYTVNNTSKHIFKSSTSTGVYFYVGGTTQGESSNAGTENLNGWVVRTTGQFFFSADDFVGRNGVDTGLSKVSAGNVGFTNGSTTVYWNIGTSGAKDIGYTSGARTTSSTLLHATEAVTLSGASTATTNIIPAGATVEGIATTTTTTITGASGYTVGDGADVDRYGDITGTAVGTNSGSTNYTADPRWWTNAARAVTLTAKTSNFTGGVVQVSVFYRIAAGT